jgi:DNA invertase Pin-like site-specific DNA recombinase
MNTGPHPERAQRVALYARTAASSQGEPSQYLDQLQWLRAFAAEHGFTIAEEYADVEVSGATPLQERRAGGRLLAGARRSAFSWVLVESADRIGRSSAALRDARASLEAAGVHIEVTRSLPSDVAASLEQSP